MRHIYRNVMVKKSYRHFFSQCTSTDFLENGECKKCRSEMSKQYAESDTGKESRARSEGKRRFQRRTTRVVEILKGLRSDLELLNLEEHFETLSLIEENVLKLKDVNVSPKPKRSST